MFDDILGPRKVTKIFSKSEDSNPQSFPKIWEDKQKIIDTYDNLSAEEFEDLQLDGFEFDFGLQNLTSMVLCI